MYSTKSRLQPEELERLVKRPRCTCARHAVYAIGHVWNPDDDTVYLVTRCYDCKRVRLTMLGDIFQWRLSFVNDEIIVPIESAFLYEQTTLLP